MRDEIAARTVPVAGRRRDLGDFQTPRALAQAVLDRLWKGAPSFTRLLEPTCGRGVFLRESLALDPPPRELIGVEIHPPHAAEASRIASEFPEVPFRIIQGSVFHLDLGIDLSWREDGPLLIVGNPPWVTAAELGRLGSGNSPTRRNLKDASGLEARTGASNFDLAEAVWIKLLEELAGIRPTIAMLCKTSVARAVLEQARRRSIPIADAALFEIDARRWFGAAVGACLMRITVGPPGVPGVDTIPVFAELEAERPRAHLGFRGGRLVADAPSIDRVSFGLGECPWTWRQGLKHDAADVMELEWSSDTVRSGWRNGLGEAVEVEAECLYPLIKGADLKGPSRGRRRRALIVTQRALGEDTEAIRDRWPLAWRYLERHAERLGSRRSSIYRGRPRFAIFGVGPYSFSPWKVAIGGLLRRPTFRVIGPVLGRPTMLDDTCYLLPCESAAEAAVLCALGNGPVAQTILAASSFPDAKRPVTKGLLQRVDLSAILLRADDGELAAAAGDLLAGIGADAGAEGASIPAVIERWKREFRERSSPHAGDRGRQ
ncbi:class I SAM-dependent methyltransferase [Aquisphaera insulae]|uniref:class I SAM-dependent methyltransferase n=1 Tax=Aquisphaera insulae TaxID=2712864 RepID=UPI0013ED5EDF|nr:class I SAM-dependent methyltransferase [Aquisphaera insulae]